MCLSADPNQATIKHMIVNGFRGFGDFGGIPLFNPILAVAARGALASQGYNPDAISPNGELNPQALLAIAYDRIEIHSSLSDPIIMNLNAPSSPGTQAVLDRIKPKLVFVGRAGRFEIAPYGTAAGIDPSISTAGTSIGIGIGAALLGIILLAKTFL